MGVEITYRCGGCDAEATVRGVRRSIEVISPGRVMDLCKVTTPTIEGSAPEGWVAFDPYTGCCYCPTCWAEIEAPDSEAAAEPSDVRSRGRNGVS